MTRSVSGALDVQVQAAGVSGDFSLALADSEVTVAEVLAAVGLAGEPVRIDGELVVEPASTRAIEVLGSGSHIGSAAHPGAPRSSVIDRPKVEVAVVAGLNAGATTQLDRGLYRVAASDSAATNSGWYLEIDRPGLLTGQAQPWHRHGSSVEMLSPTEPTVAASKPIDSEPGHSGQVHRPPRRSPPLDVSPIAIVEAPPAVQPRSALSWATLLAPIPIAIAMALFFRPLFALFAAMGPVMALFRWYESKRRFRRDTRLRNELIASLIAEVDAAAQQQAEALARLRWLSNPHVGELWKRARHNSVRLWERRQGTAGYMCAMVGIGPDLVEATVTGAKPSDEVHAKLAAPISLRPVPHVVDLQENTGVGIFGERHEILAVARSMVLQLASLHGPADLELGLICGPHDMSEWDWLKWLPHTDPRLASHSAAPIVKHLSSSSAVPNSTVDAAAHPLHLGSDDEPGVTRLIVVDDPSVDVASIMRAARRTGHVVRILAVALHPTLLPASCSSLVGMHGDSAELATPELVSRRVTVTPVGLSLASAMSWARSMAPLVDPERPDSAPARNAKVSLLQMADFTDAGQLRRRWENRDPGAPPVVAIGTTSEGPFLMDLTKDGPHALIAGTTGSGKSELLRTIVVGLAAACPPEHLNFVLVDFKGGGAFDAVAGLPHVAGLITDLDETMVRRAISSLRSELERRELIFRRHGASTYQDAVRQVAEPLPRLLIAIDEFAALAADYGDLLTSIVDLAARGRSLGMHLLLATQRPSGVVDQKIRANTNLRIALRVQDGFDSHDVVGTKAAASIDRMSPGQAVFRIGSDPPLMVQTAFGGAPDRRLRRCVANSYTLFPDHDDPPGGPRTGHDGAHREHTELQVLTAAITAANETRGYVASPLWTAPLPTMLDWIDLGSRELAADGAFDAASPPGLALGLVDLPDHQTQSPWYWDPDSGPLAIYAGSASCAGKLLMSTGAALASAHDATSAHIYVIDGDAGTIAPLAHLAHTGAYVVMEERDRIDRTLRHFDELLVERRRDPTAGSWPRVVLIIDNVASLVAQYDEIGAATILSRLTSLARDGSALRLHLVVSARTSRDIGHRLAQHMPNRLVFSLADPNGYLSLGLRSGDAVSLVPMRAIDLSRNRHVQLVEPPDFSGWPSAPASSQAGPRKIASFPQVVRRQDLSMPALDNDDVLEIPVGIESDHLSEAVLRLHANEHTLIAAANGMGRTTLLQTILSQLDAAGINVELARICSPRSALAGDDKAGELLTTVAEIESFAERCKGVGVLVIDDAERVRDDVASAIHVLIDSDDTDIRVIAATTPDFARSVRAWVHRVRSDRIGVLLGGQPSDGDLFKVRLGRLDGLGILPGRGYLVLRGRSLPTQFAHG